MCDHKRLKVSELVEGIDFYWDEIDGSRYRVFTEEYLANVRPMCCKNSCRHCPWGYKKENPSE